MIRLSQKQTFAALIFLAFMCFSVVLVDEISALRREEMSFLVSKLDEGKGSGSSLNLIEHYRLIKNRLSDSPGNFDELAAETRLAALRSSDSLSKLSKKDQESYLTSIAVSMINAVNYVTGIELFERRQDRRVTRLLEVAYYFERRRNFPQAVRLYSQVSKLDESHNEEKSYALLHRGFCLSMLDKANHAIRDYNWVIENSETKDYRFTAYVLRSILVDLRKNIEKIDSKPASLAKGKDYYKLMAYRKSIRTFNQIKKKDEEVYYNRGLAYEEIGANKKALADYRRAIANAPNSETAKKANRRMFMISTLYEKDQKLKNESLARAKKTNDSAALQKITSIQKSVLKPVKEPVQEAKIAASILKKDEVVVEPTKPSGAAKNKATSEPNNNELITPPSPVSTNEPELAELSDSDLGLIEEEVSPKKANGSEPLPELDLPKEKVAEFAKSMKAVPVLEKVVTKKVSIHPQAPPKPPEQVLHRPKLPFTVFLDLMDPRQNKGKRMETMRDNLTKVDEILTEDGNILIGIVIGKNEEEWLVLVSDELVTVGTKQILLHTEIQSKIAFESIPDSQDIEYLETGPGS